MNDLLDANAVISLLKGHPRLSERLKRHRPAEFGLSAVVVHELFHRTYKSYRRAENLAVVEALQFEVLDLDKEDAKQAGKIRAVLALAGQPIGPCHSTSHGSLPLLAAAVAGVGLVPALTSRYRVEGQEG